MLAAVVFTVKVEVPVPLDNDGGSKEQEGAVPVAGPPLTKMLLHESEIVVPPPGAGLMLILDCADSPGVIEEGERSAPERENPDTTRKRG